MKPEPTFAPSPGDVITQEHISSGHEAEDEIEFLKNIRVRDHQQFCAECGDQLSLPADKQGDIFERLAGERVFGFSDCVEHFFTYGEVSQHIKQFHGPKTYKCWGCRYKSTFSSVVDRIKNREPICTLRRGKHASRCLRCKKLILVKTAAAHYESCLRKDKIRVDRESRSIPQQFEIGANFESNHISKRTIDRLTLERLSAGENTWKDVGFAKATSASISPAKRRAQAKERLLHARLDLNLLSPAELDWFQALAPDLQDRAIQRYAKNAVLRSSTPLYFAKYTTSSSTYSPSELKCSTGPINCLEVRNKRGLLSESFYYSKEKPNGIHTLLNTQAYYTNQFFFLNNFLFSDCAITVKASVKTSCTK